MSGDVQPRKRKDKKRKKDELGVEEPRGTAAVLGEGDVFMHSQHEHGTGGHWCAKIIFFSLLAVLVTLVGLIILENRGLSELEANSVESRYSGVLEGWLEDAPDDDHHDEHTLELKHHDDEDEDHSPELSHDDDDDEHGEVDDHDEQDDDDHDDEADGDHENDEDDDEGNEYQENDEDDDEAGDSENEQQEDSEEKNLDEDDENEDRDVDSDEDQKDDDEDENDVLQEIDENDSAADDDINEQDDEANDQSAENDVKHYDDDEDEDNSDENEQDDSETRDNENPIKSMFKSHTVSQETTSGVEKKLQSRGPLRFDDEKHEDDEEEEDLAVEVERLEKEVSDDYAFSEELDAAPEVDDDDKSEEVSSEAPEADADDDDDVAAEDEEFLEPDDIEEDLPVVEHIVAPKGKPFVEVEEASTVKPTDTLAEEEEYEKQQEELKREQEQASHMWLKLAVGGALLVATHAVVSRAIAPRDDTPASDEHASREETPVIDRRMTLISEERTAVAPIEVEEEIQPVVEEVVTKLSSVIKTAPPPKEESEEEIGEEENEDDVIIDTKNQATEEAEKEETDDKELYSDEEEAEDEEEEVEIVKEITEAHKQSAATQKVEVKEEEEADEDVPDDVEIIDDEQLEEELEEEDDEEDISDVDDAELLTRLEAKYGRLPEPERPGPKQSKLDCMRVTACSCRVAVGFISLNNTNIRGMTNCNDGGNSIEDDWPGEPSDQYWRQQLDQAEEEIRQGAWRGARARLGAAAGALRDSARARWLLARATDAAAEAARDNKLLSEAINKYLDVLKMNERLSDARLLEVTNRTLDRMRFRGNYLSAEPVYRLLIRRFPDISDYYNNLTVSFLIANRADLAEQVVKEILQKWPEDRKALAHLGYVLKTQHNRLEEAVDAFQKALKGDVGPATEPRFYYHLGDALLLLGRYAEAHEVHKRGAAHGHFLSPAQRSLYNVERLKSSPWWNIEQTPYSNLARALEKSWKDILKEGEEAKALYEKEKEGLRERGEWSQFDLFVRGQEVPGRCKRAPVTCSIIRSEPAAAGCRRGQVKFSAMEAGTHVRPHAGPTNCRLRMHLGLSNTKDTYIRVDQETRQWQVGKTFMFDDSFEHEVWHNGSGTRLVLIVDVWHPALSAAERRALLPI